LDINKDFRQLEKQIDRMLNGKEKVIGKHYANLLKEIRHKLSDWDVKHGLSYEELNKYGRLEKLEKQVADIVRKGTTPVSREIRFRCQGRLNDCLSENNRCYRRSYWQEDTRGIEA